MKQTTKILTALVLSSSFIFTGAMAMGHGDGHHKMRGFNVERMAHKLSLTDAQSAKIQVLVDAHKKQRKSVDRKAMKEKRSQHKESYVAMMNSPQFDEAMIRENMAARSAAQAERKIEKMRLKHSIYQVLNEDQREQFLAMASKKRHKMKKRMKKHHREHDDE